jgi:nucleolar protein 53
MGKTETGKRPKGKRSKQIWAEIEEDEIGFRERENRDNQLGFNERTVAAELVDEDLFVEDLKGGRIDDDDDDDGKKRKKLTKRERVREKSLKMDSILSKPRPMKTYPVPTKHRGCDGNKAVMKMIKKKKKSSSSSSTNTNTNTTVLGDAMMTIETTDNAENAAAGAFWERHFPRVTGIARHAMKILKPTVDRKFHKPVQVDEPGCSYNPPEDLRNEVVLKAAAKEIQKEYKEQLNPVKAPLLGYRADAMRIKELYYETGFGDEDEDDDNDEEERIKKRENSKLNEKLNKTARNKRARHQELQKEIEERKALKKQRRDLSELKLIKKDIQEKEKLDEVKRLRKQLARKEREETQPRRLGKHKFEEDLPEVLFKEEVSGNLRTLKGAHALLKDRLKSYQRRELIEPRKRQIKKKSKMMMKYEPGARGERESENQKEINALNAQIKAAKKSK